MKSPFSTLLLASLTALFFTPTSALADPKRPQNVLFIISDDMRPWLACYGHPQAKTPNLDRLAASGVRFNSAHVQCALCMPSRTSMLSGTRPSEAGQGWFIGPESALNWVPHLRSIRSLRPGIVSLPEHLRKHGWHTVSIGKIGHDWDTDGFDELQFGPNERDFYLLPENVAKIKNQKLPGRGIPFEAADLPDAQFNDGKMALDAVKTLKALKAAGKPFFLGVGFWRPHMPLVCPKKYWDMYPASEVILPTNLKQPADVGPLARISGPSQVNWKNYRLPEKPDGSLDEANMREMIRGYLACISFVDAQVGIVLDALKAEGLDRNTIVVFWGDNGYHLGEQGEWSKVTNYEEATRVPLIIRDPAAPHGGAVVEQPVETLDLFQTLCDLVGLPAPAHLEGESLRPLLRGEPGRKKDYAVSVVLRGGAERWIVSKTERWEAVGWSLRTATHRYTLWLDSRTKQPLQRELFDHATDPGENKNLAADPAHAATLQALHDKLMREVIQPQRKATASRQKTVTLDGPAFALTLDTSDGLRAVSWENKLTGRKLSLGNGPEVELDIGLPGKPLIAPKLRVTGTPKLTPGASGEAVFELAADDPKLSVTVTYRWDAKQPLLRKFVTITNRSGQEWNRLLNVRLGSYQTDAKAEDPDPDYPASLETRIDDLAGKARGFPAYVEWQFFVGLAHPAGFVTREDSKLSLRQLPGTKLAAGASFECMEAVYGVSREGQARQAFRDHVQSRMRRVLRGHDKPLAIFEPFGAKPGNDVPGGVSWGGVSWDAHYYWETEEFVLDDIAKVAEGQRNSGLHWDYYSIDFWTDPKGDLKTPSTELFPNGFTQILPELKKLGTLPGLWVDSGGNGTWTIGKNPALENALTTKTGRIELCRATEPANRFYIEGYAHQLHINGVRLVKFDNALLSCDNPGHDHLPGEYSVEPIEDALIEFYRGLDRQCPDVFIMLYWRYQSPWWLQYADMVYDIGMHMEGASFSPSPTLRARDSVTRRLDSGRWILKDWPALGWDTLGIWLSDWPWNSRIGKEAWQGGVIMDISRGHLLAQLWSDTPYLSPDERRQMADFIALLKAQPDCFRNPRFILGNPWKEEPYGYCCTDGRRAFLAINNGVWKDSTLALQLNSAWGLPEGKRWELYRWWPNATKLGKTHGSKTTISLRPFDVVLLEVVAAGDAPTLNRKFQSQPMPTSLAEPSRALPITVEKSETTHKASIKPTPQKLASEKTFVVRGTVPATKTGGMLAVSDAFFVQSNPHWTLDCKEGFTVAGTVAGKAAAFEPVINNGLYRAPWQTWRLPVAPSDTAHPFELRLTSSLPANVEHRFSTHFAPR